MPEDGGLEDLRRAWREMQGPDPERGLGHPDAKTRAALVWLRGAWQRVAPPALPVTAPAAPAWRRNLALIAAAAVALVAPGLRQRRPPATAEPPRPSANGSALEVVALTSERTELRSGPVRLILLTHPSGRSGLSESDPNGSPKVQGDRGSGPP